MIIPNSFSSVYLLFKKKIKECGGQMKKIFLAIFAWFSGWFPEKPLACAPNVQPVTDGKRQVKYRLLEDYRILRVVVHKGVEADGASIPLFLVSLLGAHPFSPAIIAQAIAHDAQYQSGRDIYYPALKARDKTAKKAAMGVFKRADKWFYFALRLNNRKIRSVLFYVAVRAYSTLNFGLWKWYIAYPIQTLLNKEK
jgi:hypothetical protein